DSQLRGDLRRGLRRDQASLRGGLEPRCGGDGWAPSGHGPLKPVLLRLGIAREPRLSDHLHANGRAAPAAATAAAAAATTATATATASSSPAASATSTAPSSAASTTTSATSAACALPCAAADRPQAEDGSDEGSRGEMRAGPGQACSLAPRRPRHRPEPPGGRVATPRNAGQSGRRPPIAVKKAGPGS